MNANVIANDRNATIAVIKSALRERSGKVWSVKGGTGTAWGWITISAPPKRLNEYGYMSADDCAELAALLSLPTVHFQGVSIPASSAYRAEHIARAKGQTPETFGTQYWD